MDLEISVKKEALIFSCLIIGFIILFFVLTPLTSFSVIKLNQYGFFAKQCSGEFEGRAFVKVPRDFELGCADLFRGHDYTGIGLLLSLVVSFASVMFIFRKNLDREFIFGASFSFFILFVITAIYSSVIYFKLSSMFYSGLSQFYGFGAFLILNSLILLFSNDFVRKGLKFGYLFVLIFPVAIFIHDFVNQ